MRLIVIAALCLAGSANAQTPSAGPQPTMVRRMPAPMPPPAFEGQGGEARMTLVDSRPVVEVVIGARGPYRFLVDTGAGGHGRVRPEFAQALGLAVAGEMRATDGSGVSQIRRSFALPPMRLAGVTFSGVQMGEIGPAARLPQGIDGVVGLGLFAGHLATLDYAGGKLTLGQGGLPESVTPYVIERGVIAIPAMVGGKPVPVHLDTGNAVAALILPKALVDTLPQRGAPRRAGQVSTALSTVDIWNADLAVDVSIGGLVLKSPTVAYPSLGETGNLGSKALGNAVVRIDQRNRRVSIETVGAAK